ncbi:unnamed protein product [Auanema sp. JU1783]|nr:unnamed protein product [Auanema sp. JU1783]
MDFLSSRARIERLPSPGVLPRDDDLVELLKSPDFDTRLQTLNRATNLSKRDPGWFSRILVDDRWEVQHQCIKFLIESMPVFGSSLEYCMCYVMPNIITKLGSSKITVRRASIQLIQNYLKFQPIALGSLLKMVTYFLIQTKESKTLKSEVISELPSLFIPEVSQSNFFLLLQTLLSYTPHSDKDNESVAHVLQKLRVFVGKDSFSHILQSLTDAEKKKFQSFEYLMKNEKVEIERGGSSSSLGRISAKYSQERRFRFAIVPMFISAMITDEDASQKISGLEKLKQIIEKIGAEDIQKFVPHLHSYLMTMGHVLSDLNFKVVVLSLDVLRLTVNRLKNNIDAHLQQVISLLSKHFGNQKAVIKQLIMMTCMDLFQNLQPKSVIGALSVFLENRNSRIREEVVNIITSALMVISATKINFTAIINILVPMLLDPKRRVRLAAFEQISVVAYLMNGKVDSLLKAIREAEQKSSCTGLTTAVQARIRRHLLPRIRYDGLIEYSTPPVSDNSFDIDEAQLVLDDNMDLHFILHGAGDHERAISPVSAIDLKGIASLPRRAPTTENDQSNFESYKINLNSSTNSWHTPPRRKVSLTLEDRSASAAIVRNNFAQKDSLEKANSTSNVENQPPAFFDDAPIRSAKTDTSTIYDVTVPRSNSHHNLNMAPSAHASIKSTMSSPGKKAHNFLKCGGGNRAKTVVKRQPSPSKPGENTKKQLSSVKTAIEAITDEDWAQKVIGLQTISSLASSNSILLHDHIKEIVKAVISECKNLRSSVSRVALSCLGNLFQGLASKMDPEVDKCASILMNKTGDVSNAFIRDDASAALEKLAAYSSPYKAMIAILNAGSSSKNNTIRAACAQFVDKLINRIGTSQLLSNTDHLSNVLPHLISFAKDRNPHVRQQGKQSLLKLSEVSHFDKSMKKVSEVMYKKVEEALESNKKNRSTTPNGLLTNPAMKSDSINKKQILK